MLKEGLKHTETVTVGKENVASTVGSGGLDVFATPAMIALMEKAARKCVQPYLPEGSSTVGTHVNVSHDLASKMGNEITATAKLKQIEGRKLTFDVRAEDSGRVIGQGVHERFVVDIEKFLSKLQ